MVVNKIVIENIVSVEALVSMISEEIFVKHIKPFLQKNQAEKELVYFTRSETAKKLKCSLGTLNTRVNDGLINPTHFGGKVLFSDVDIEKALHKF